MRTLSPVLLGLLLWPAVPSAPPLPVEVAALDPIDIKEWPVPWERTRPRDPYVGPDGKAWFVGQQGHYLAHLIPSAVAY